MTDNEANAFLAQPEPEDLPPGYIDAEHTGHDRKMLETFYKACRSEGGTADEIHLRGLKALLALAQPAPGEPTLMQVIALADEIEAEGLGQVDLVRRALARWGRPAIQPVPVAEQLPEAGQKVIAYYLNALGNRRTILAEWVPAKSRTDDCLVQDDFAEYDEETDQYYWPEGWYESIENWDDYGAVFVNEGVITHWQPLPAGPALSPGDFARATLARWGRPAITLAQAADD